MSLSPADKSLNVVLVDYHKGNIRSVEKALIDAGASVVVSDDPSVVEQADAIVLPGVGAFKDAMDTLTDLSLDSAILKSIEKGTPFLGICLGLHLLFEGGMEHAQDGNPIHGLSVLPGVVEAMPKMDMHRNHYKIPHVGWNTVNIVDENALDNGIFSDVGDNEYFYFTHSYIAPQSDATIATTTHSIEFPSAVHKDNIWAVQFHPEKSSDAGAKLFTSFLDRVCRGKV